MKKDNKTKMLNVRIDINLINKFIEHCKRNGYSISKRIRVLIEKDINGK